MSDSSPPPPPAQGQTPPPAQGQTPPPAQGQTPPPTQGPASDEKTLSIVSHLLMFVCGIIGPLIIYLIKKDESAYVRHHSAEALNFQISICIYAIVSAFLTFVLIGIPMLLAVAIISLIYTIIAAIKASEGTLYRYPLTIRLIN